MRADRLLKIVLLLQSRGRMTTSELADELEVTRRTVSRDMEALGQAGLPVEALRGRGGGWSLMDGYRSGLTAMTPQETAALMIRASAGPLRDLGLEESYESARRKLQAAYPGSDRRDAAFLRSRLLIDEAGWHGSAPDVPEALAVCQEAVWDVCLLRFAYGGDGGGPARERTVRPLGLVVKRGVWYLIARDEGADKTFRVSKLGNPRKLEETFDYPEAFDLAACWAASLASFTSRLPHYEAELLLPETELPAFKRERYVRVLREQSRGDGTARVRADLATPEFALRFVLGFGASVRVLEPGELAGAVAEEAGRLARLYKNS
ncbi:YafY family protein [Saccharibacillus sp. CPCC 101409]|uniref:helix-turn-helix transcriptional regulator n=1 Tax=Saccharibacillus sp. CPCC 101409 TaxID=3058041 RepID=UPI002673E6F9|nr:YafY family protein [Saccharibacillus sp. CPCC 101409]MDO3409494.1 YafY family protein [Saccharibacillus sp. CPCC 101409]